MIRYIRDLRLIPIALIASACLLALKTADLMLDGGYWLTGDNAPASDSGASVIRTSPDAPQPPGRKLSWAQQVFGFPDGSGAVSSPDIAPLADRLNADVTGSVTKNPERNRKRDTDAEGDIVGAIGDEGKDNKDKDAKDKDKDAKDAKDAKADVPGMKGVPPVKGTVIPSNGTSMPSGAERAILERLQERRQELDTRARELDIRESLINAAEKRMDARLAELKEVEGRITSETQKKDDADAARFKSLVTMYENMKPRDAAKIFNRLETDVLLEVASQINPRQMAEILAQMSPDMAERLTVELASKLNAVKPGASPSELPKIEGNPTTP